MRQQALEPTCQCLRWHCTRRHGIQSLQVGLHCFEGVRIQGAAQLVLKLRSRDRGYRGICSWRSRECGCLRFVRLRILDYGLNAGCIGCPLSCSTC